MTVSIEYNEGKIDPKQINQMTEKAVNIAVEKLAANQKCTQCGGSNLVASIEEVTDTEIIGNLKCDNCSYQRGFTASHNLKEEISNSLNDIKKQLFSSFKK